MKQQQLAGALGWIGSCGIGWAAPMVLPWWTPHWAFWLGVFGGVNLLSMFWPYRDKAKI